ncbi:MAG: glycosyltransferase family 2 protein, partial [Gammaproteobacteria bacterium]
ALSARVLVGPENRLDPTCERMAASPLDCEGLPGPALIGFMAGAVVMRTEAFRETGGYEPRFFLGAEEALMGLELAARGWAIVYASDVVAHHHPSAARDACARRVMLVRNRLWIAWLRLPLVTAWHETRHVMREAGSDGTVRPALLAALRGLPWVLPRRRPVPESAHRMWLRVHGVAPVSPAPAGRAESERRARQ